MQNQIQFLRCMTDWQACPTIYTSTAAWQWYFIISIFIGLMQSLMLTKGRHKIAR